MAQILAKKHCVSRILTYSTAIGEPFSQKPRHEDSHQRGCGYRLCCCHRLNFSQRTRYRGGIATDGRPFFTRRDSFLSTGLIVSCAILCRIVLSAIDPCLSSDSITTIQCIDSFEQISREIINVRVFLYFMIIMKIDASLHRLCIDFGRESA